MGYGLGQIYSWPSDRRRSLLLGLGLSSMAGFVVLRTVKVYGDPLRWSAQKSTAFTVLSFLNTTKYAMLLLWTVDAVTPRWLSPALIFGKVPMFYYLLHVPLIHLIALAVCYARYGHVHWIFESPDVGNFPIVAPPGWGYSLPVIYLVWVVVVIALYPPCRWFAGVRQRRNNAWLSYF